LREIGRYRIGQVLGVAIANSPNIRAATSR
jgi:hypothetical protein